MTIYARRGYAYHIGVQTTGVITVEDGNYNVVFTKVLDYTDFPAPEITLWFTNNVIYLPEERRTSFQRSPG